MPLPCRCRALLFLAQHSVLGLNREEFGKLSNFFLRAEIPVGQPTEEVFLRVEQEAIGSSDGEVEGAPLEGALRDLSLGGDSTLCYREADLLPVDGAFPELTEEIALSQNRSGEDEASKAESIDFPEV